MAGNKDVFKSTVNAHTSGGVTGEASVAGGSGEATEVKAQLISGSGGQDKRDGTSTAPKIGDVTSHPRTGMRMVYTAPIAGGARPSWKVTAEPLEGRGGYVHNKFGYAVHESTLTKEERAQRLADVKADTAEQVAAASGKRNRSASSGDSGGASSSAPGEKVPKRKQLSVREIGLQTGKWTAKPKDIAKTMNEHFAVLKSHLDSLTPSRPFAVDSSGEAAQGRQRPTLPFGIEEKHTKAAVALQKAKTALDNYTTRTHPDAEGKRYPELGNQALIEAGKHLVDAHSALSDKDLIDHASKVTGGSGHPPLERGSVVDVADHALNLDQPNVGEGANKGSGKGLFRRAGKPRNKVALKPEKGPKVVLNLTDPKTLEKVIPVVLDPEVDSSKIDKAIMGTPRVHPVERKEDRTVNVDPFGSANGVKIVPGTAATVGDTRESDPMTGDTMENQQTTVGSGGAGPLRTSEGFQQPGQQAPRGRRKSTVKKKTGKVKPATVRNGRPVPATEETVEVPAPRNSRATVGPNGRTVESEVAVGVAKASGTRTRTRGATVASPRPRNAAPTISSVTKLLEAAKASGNASDVAKHEATLADLQSRKKTVVAKDKVTEREVMKDRARTNARTRSARKGKAAEKRAKKLLGE